MLISQADAALRRSCAEISDITLSRESDPAGWVTPALIASDPAVVDELVDRYQDHYQRLFGTSFRRDIAALWLLSDLAYVSCVVTIGSLPSSGPLLVASADAIGAALPRGAELRINVDPASVESATGPLEVLYAAARRQLSGLLGPAVEALGAGSRAGWACVTDQASAVIWAVASKRGGSRLAAAHSALLLTATGEPQDHLLHGLRLRPSVRLGSIRVRHGCCLLYAVGNSALCESCPRITS